MLLGNNKGVAMGAMMGFCGLRFEVSLGWYWVGKGSQGFVAPVRSTLPSPALVSVRLRVPPGG